MIYVPAKLIVWEDGIATAQNLVAFEYLFRFGILTSFLVQLINILLVLVLYKLLKPVSKNAAVLMAVFFLVSVPISMLNELNHLAALQFAHHVTEWQAMMLCLHLHKYGMNIASIFWGLWLLPMGYLVSKSGFLPKFLGTLLIIGGLGYLADVLIFVLFPESKIMIGQYTFMGEVLFPLWLLIKGVNEKKWKKVSN
jgi:hypothetical protein